MKEYILKLVIKFVTHIYYQLIRNMAKHAIIFLHYLDIDRVRVKKTFGEFDNKKNQLEYSHPSIYLNQEISCQTKAFPSK